MSSSAVTLGRHSGAAVIGQTLDIRVQVLLAPGEDLANQCINADVFYGDAQVPSALVRSTPLRTAAGAEPAVRIQASQPINEPIVTLNVRAGCGSPFTRRFVLLADPLSEPVADAARSPLAAAIPVPVVPTPVAPAQAAPGTPATSAGRSNGGAGGQATAPRNPGATPAARTTPSAATRPAPAPRTSSVVRRAPAPAAPRLQLDPLDLDPGIERDPKLKLSPLLLSEPSTNEEARAAAGRLWKALNASPEEVLRDAQKVAELEAQATQLRAADAQNRSRIGELNTELEQARDQIYRNWLVYLLGGLLLLALLALLLQSRRRPVQQAAASDASRAWWSASDAEKAAPEEAPAPTERKGPRAANSRIDLDLELDRDSSPAELRPLATASPSRGNSAPSDAVVPLAARDRREFSASAMGVSRSVATEELFDIQQQADFFVSLGEDDQAIQVLRSHLAESHEPSPLAYLDLFKLYHRLGRRSEYEALRDEFNHVFNAGAPPFNYYTDGGRGLEAYEAAFSRIQSLWPQPRVLDLIEESIFRNAQDDEVEVFDLEAYRELLLLHAIAKDLIQRDPRSSPQSEFLHTSMQPLKVQAARAAAAAAMGVQDDGRGGRNTQPMGLDALIPASSNLGLDINLDDLSEFSAFEASLPEVLPAVQPTAHPGAAGLDAAPSNLIDFEVLDFMPPEDEQDAKTGGKT